MEGMLRSAIEKYCNDLGFLDIVIGLIESLPNDTSPRIIDASTSIFRTLEQMCTGADVDERLLIKSRMKEFVINIVSRYNILDNPWPDNDSWKDGSIKEFLLTVEAAGFDVSQYGWCLKDMNIDRMISAINVVYPTGNLLLDVIFSEFTVYNSYLLMCSDKHAPDYMEQEDVEFYLAEQLYDLGKEEVQEGTDEYAENSVYRDPIMQVLDTSGINYIEIYKKLHASRRLNDKMQDFVGGASKILETNTVYKSYVIQYALHAIIEKAFIDREPELLPQTLFRLIPDYQGMYKLFKCRDMQPQNHLYDKNNSCEPFLINNKDEYILIGCSEIKKHIDYHQTSLIFAYQGIVGEAGDEHQIPFQQYLATAVEEGEIYTILDNPESLIDFIRTLDRELEDEDYLWPGTSVSKLLDVHIEFDFLNGRYIAINQEKDVVFL